MSDQQNWQYQKWGQGDGSTVSGCEQPLEAVLHQLQYLQTEVQLLQAIFIFDILSPNFVNVHRGQKTFRYDLILKMETFTRDSFYISKQLGLKFKVDNILLSSNGR